MNAIANIPEMAESMEHSCVSFLKSQSVSPLDDIDRDEIMRATRSMKREYWQPAAGVTRDTAIAYQYINYWKDLRSDELMRFNITPNRVCGIFKNDPTVKQVKARRHYKGSTFYVLNNGGQSK